MARAKISDVINVLPVSTILNESQILQAIDAASCLVDQVATCAPQLSEACLAQVEIYLSAHYAASVENTLSTSSQTDGCCDSSVTYGFKFGEGIKGTPFGQMANTLSSGCLAEFDKQPINFVSIGCR
mgnify:CR=1 FL=1